MRKVFVVTTSETDGAPNNLPIYVTFFHSIKLKHSYLKGLNYVHKIINFIFIFVKMQVYSLTEICIHANAISDFMSYVLKFCCIFVYFIIK